MSDNGATIDPRVPGRIEEIQSALRRQDLDALLVCGFHDIDPLTRRILHCELTPHITRRWFYLVPKEGSPRKLRHRIESTSMAWWPGEVMQYLSWRELETGLEWLCRGCGRVAMHYSAEGAVPTVSLVDAGMIELIRKSCDVEIVSSGELVQEFEAKLTGEQIASHDEAADHLYRIVAEAYEEIGKTLRAGGTTNEYEVQEFIMKRFADAELVTDSRPIVGANGHAGDPHYEPTREKHAGIATGDFVLIDLWAKKSGPEDVMADITWVGFAGAEVPEKIRKVFDIVSSARDAAFDFVEQAFREGRPIQGLEVDDVCRGVIETAGYGEYFIHRTGHSIGRETHGFGANIDNLETRDTRRIVPNTCFSIEPGIYLEDFGVRSEIDVMIDGDPARARITGQEPQTEVLRILS